VGRLRSRPRVMRRRRLGSRVSVSASFQIFALTAGENVLGGEGKCPSLTTDAIGHVGSLIASVNIPFVGIAPCTPPACVLRSPHTTDSAKHYLMQSIKAVVKFSRNGPERRSVTCVWRSTT